jgi:ABC-type multidrug transport system ATPase subunit
MNAIEINNFRKHFGDVEAVKGVSFAVEKGELFGLIGPDGAGKTTLLRAICTLLLPDEGNILVENFDTTKHISQIRAILGYMPQRFSLYQDLTVAQNLRFFADLFQVLPGEREERLAQLYQFSKLEPFQKRLAGALSGGMKQKLALSCALIHTPKILVLDEPTFGVDPVSRKEFWDILREIQKQGTTILVSTAYMDEADQCQRVALFFQGKIAALGTPGALKTQYRYPLFKLHAGDLRRLKEYFLAAPEVYSTQLFGDSLHVSFKETPSAERWRLWQSENQGNLKNWSPQKPSIEDVFLDLIRE